MKRIVRLCMMFIVLVCLTACGVAEEKSGDEKTTKEEISVGFGKADITPYDPVHLGSYNNTAGRLSRGYKEPLYSTAVVITDKNDNTVVFIVTDLSWGFYVQSNQIRQELQKEYGIPEECVLLGGTHNHSAPDYSYDSEEVKTYMEYWLNGVKDSVKKAMEDRKPAEMQVGRTETENLTFVRRYWLEDGTFLTDNTSSTKKIVSHETEADEEIQMVRFKRDGAKDIYITNWQSHCAKEGDTLNATSDWVGVVREQMETELDCHCIYFQGAAGNLNPTSRIEGECDTTSAREHGEAVAKYAIDACRKDDTFKTVKSGSIQVKRMMYKDYNPKVKEGLSKAMQERAENVELTAVMFGDVSVVTFPAEMFDTTGMQIKNQTPSEMTLLMGYTNGVHGYLPDEKAFPNGGYEATSTIFLPGAAEDFVSMYLDTLNEFQK